MKSKRAKRSSSDIISTFPQTILETILCLLPTQEAARTSILSREWRYKWTKISKLEFHLPLVLKRITDEKQVQGKNMDGSCKPFYDLHQVLLSHQGPIHEFSLFMDQSTADEDSFGFDQVVLHLSKNHTVKKLKLYGLNDYSWHNLPVSIFSLHHLIDLDLTCFNLDYEPIFNGFGSLRSLSLNNVGISTKTLLHLLSNCPSLKSLTLLIDESRLGGKDCTVIELFKCLPMIEHMTTSGSIFEWLVIDSVPQELPTLLFHLKYFCFEEMCFAHGHGLAFLLVLIKCSPYLEKIKLEINWDHTSNEEYSIIWEEYSNVWLEHLNELKIEYFGNSKPEIEFVKFILSRSPKLKKVNIITTFDRRQGSEVLKTFSQASRTPVTITVASRTCRSLNFLEI